VKRPTFAAALVCLLHAVAPPAEAARRDTLALRPLSLSLPGPPASVLPADLDGDGRKDLVVVVAYGHWIEIGEDRIEGLTMVTEVVPSLVEKREIRAWIARPDGTYRPLASALPLGTDVIAAEPGPPGAPVLLLTDAGLASLRLDAATGTLRADPVVSDRPACAGAGTFLPGRLGTVADLDGDGVPDALLPGADGPAVYLGSREGLAKAPASRLALPGDTRRAGRAARRSYPLPRVEDVDGDRRPDLVVERRGRDDGEDARGFGLHVLPGLGGGRFGSPVEIDLARLGVRPPPAPDPERERERARRGERRAHPRELAWFGDLDGDGRAELVTRERIDTGRREVEEEKAPRSRYAFHRLEGKRLVPATEPYRVADALGHAFDLQGDALDVAAFQDLDGDGRKDLVTVTFDFSILQALKVLTTKSFSLGLDFHVYRHHDDGSFAAVPDLDLSEKLKFDLDDLRIGRFAQFSGDFDGDGRADFVHLGRGKVVTIHRGREGARYPKQPDLSLPLSEPLEDIAQARVEDLDGDGRADLAITRPGRAEPGVLPPVTLDLYLSGSAVEPPR
jgi:hypothetical protein